MNVLIAMDAFKGCASSSELAGAVKEGICAVFPKAILSSCIIADGGEGTLEAMVVNCGGKILTCKVHDPLMRPIEARYGILGEGLRCVIEMAQASGLPLVSLDERNPMKTTTYGVGELIKEGIAKGCRNFIVGIGGSATNDAGLGMLQALGFSFLDKEGKSVGKGGEALGEIVQIDTANVLPELARCSFVLACDVDNPMYGPNGAAQIYGRQKGASEAQVLLLDRNVAHFSRLIEEQLGKKVAHIEGSGAAGALGGGFLAFLNATLHSGIDIVLDSIAFDKNVQKVDFVITGEGKIDAQSTMGKVISGVAKRCAKHHIPLLAFAGQVEENTKALYEEGVTALFSIMKAPISLEEAMHKETTLRLLKQSVEDVFRLIKRVRT